MHAFFDTGLPAFDQSIWARGDLVSSAAMIEGKPSTTSAMVAFFRALNTVGITRVRDFSDPFAAQMLPPSFERVLRGVNWLVAHRQDFAQRIWMGSRGLIDTVALRSRAIDAAWAEAHERGTRQLVILGAGLDARAYRLERLHDVHVFEVDHPATQQFKRARAQSLQSPAKSLRYVPVDFGRDALGPALRDAGLRTDERAFVIWEGVTMYLPHHATVETLAAIGAVVPSGSTLAMTYVEPEALQREPLVRKNLRRWILARSGEPQLGLIPRALAAQFLDGAGFRVVRDEGRPELSARYSDESSDTAWSGVRERIVIAEKATG